MAYGNGSAGSMAFQQRFSYRLGSTRAMSVSLTSAGIIDGLLSKLPRFSGTEHSLYHVYSSGPIVRIAIFSNQFQTFLEISFLQFMCFVIFGHRDVVVSSRSPIFPGKDTWPITWWFRLYPGSSFRHAVSTMILRRFGTLLATPPWYMTQNFESD